MSLDLFFPLSLQDIFCSARMFEIFFYFSLTAMTDFSDISTGNSDNSSGAKQLKIIRKKKAVKRVLETVAEPIPEFTVCPHTVFE